jgi:hypothetical protein
VLFLFLCKILIILISTILWLILWGLQPTIFLHVCDSWACGICRPANGSGFEVGIMKEWTKLERVGVNQNGKMGGLREAGWGRCSYRVFSWRLSMLWYIAVGRQPSHSSMTAVCEWLRVSAPLNNCREYEAEWRMTLQLIYLPGELQEFYVCYFIIHIVKLKKEEIGRSWLPIKTLSAAVDRWFCKMERLKVQNAIKPLSEQTINECEGMK